MINYCRTCALCDPSQSVCRLFHHKIDIDQDFCSRHTKSLIQCEICGAPMLEPFIDLSIEGEYHVICGNCASSRSSCSFCKKNTLCSFENDPSPLPKVITKTMQQGNSYIQTQIRNPERVRETCEKNCFCFDAENGCLRQNNWCNKQEFSWGGSHA